MKKRFLSQLPAMFVATSVAVGALTACNSESNKYDVDEEPSSSTAISGFKLKANSKVMAHLDSVFFSVDLNNGVIFNADSLPKGTVTEKLVPVISYESSISKVALIFTDANGNQQEVDYKKNSTDTINFSKPVTLRLTAQNTTTVRDYTIKVNVHKMNPDSLMWDNLASSKLPSRLANPKNQRSVFFKDKVASFILESDGSYTLSTISDPANGSWQKESVQLPANTDLRSITAVKEQLFLLADGALYSSADGKTWSDTGSRWTSVIGAFGDALLGIRSDGQQLLHTSYPTGAFAEAPVAENFPLSGTSEFHTFSNKWTVDPIGLLVGGRMADGTLSGATWGFDGYNWADISANELPALEEPILIPYYTYRKTSSMWRKEEIKTWIAIGGITKDGSVSRKVYVSYDSAVNWVEASDGLVLPEFVPAMYGADAVIVDAPMNGSLSNAWQKMPALDAPCGFTRLTYNIDGYDISWLCPNIYIFGGYGEDSQMYDQVWKAFLARLSFIPLI